MSSIHLKQPHELGLKKARVAAYQWAEEAEQKLSMTCEYEEGDSFDCVHFKRSGAEGTLYVRANEFEIKAKLGFMLSAFKDRIEAEIVSSLNTKLNLKLKGDAMDASRL
jgi:putative polyhydroxyalkanoate system protein